MPIFVSWYLNVCSSYLFVKGEVLLRFITNPEERQKILLACHVHPTAGHLGKTRTIYKIKERFMWHGIVRDVKSLVSCLIAVCEWFIWHSILYNILQCVLYINTFWDKYTAIGFKMYIPYFVELKPWHLYISLRTHHTQVFKRGLAID